MTDRGIWLKTEPDLDGVYHLVLELGEDDVIPLPPDIGYGWAREVLTAAAQAEYDALVLAQATSLDMPTEAAGMLVSELRSKRASVVTIPGLALIPGVSAFTREAFLVLQRHGKPIGQWGLDDARNHALAVIEGVEGARLDTTYRAALLDFGLDETSANAAVYGLLEHR